MARIRLLTALTVIAAAGALEIGAQEQVSIHTRTASAEMNGRPGDVVRLEVACGCETARASATVFGRDVPLSRNGEQWQGWIGIDLDVGPGTYPISVSVEPLGKPAIAARHELLVVDRQFPVRRLQVAPRFVDPPPRELTRIARESAALQSIYERATTPRQWQGAFLVPVNGEATGSFGARSVFNGQARSPHSGADFGAKTGTPVIAPGAGVVRLAKSLYFTGNTVVLDHGLGLYSVLAHLSAFNVREGDSVNAGDTIGRVGATGRVTAPHLHWSVRLNEARVDPLSLIAITKLETITR